MEHATSENVSAMRRHLLSVWKIRWHSACLADYSVFLSSARAFLHGCDNHAVFVKPICKGFRVSRNRRIIALLYSLSSLIKVEKFFIDESTVMKHFRHRSLRPSILQCISSFNLSILDTKVVRLVALDLNFSCKSLYELVGNRKEYARDLMHREDIALAHKQLSFIVNCNITYNLEYFVKFLGSQSRMLSFRAFEAFNVVFQELETAASYGVLDTSSIPPCISYSNESLRFSLSISHIAIDDTTNFLQFGFEFLEERDRVVDLVGLCKTDAGSCIPSLNTIIGKYAQSFTELDESSASKIRLCYRKHVSEEHEPHADIQSFDFLFQRRASRDICDCYEF